MIFDVMTLFPDVINQVTDVSTIGRAKKNGFISVNSYNIRDYSENKNRNVDDEIFGGGIGMLMAAPPIFNCYEDISKKYEKKPYCIYMSPKGKVLTQKKALELSGKGNIVILCGHYEGIDDRIIDLIVDEELSIGDYVLTGGEVPACILIDCVSRMIPGVLPDEECFQKESISMGELEYPQYTRPYEFMGLKVPDVLISGNHAAIEEWRKKAALEMTKKRRPDLL